VFREITGDTPSAYRASYASIQQKHAEDATNE
jgi:hypothetical protein